MRLMFDPLKDVANLAKHGVALSFAEALEWAESWVWTDVRREYGENRQCALVPNGQRLYFVAFVDRGEVRRVISLRKANQREVKIYVDNN